MVGSIPIKKVYIYIYIDSRFKKKRQLIHGNNVNVNISSIPITKDIKLKFLLHPYKFGKHMFGNHHWFIKQKYWRENDAKFRAIEQRVPTYEDFRQMVLGSHLRPLEKGESLRDEKGQIATKKVWNSMAEASGPNAVVSSFEVESYQQMVMKHAKPKSSLEFVKVWNQLEVFF